MPSEVVSLARALVGVDSTTGREGMLGEIVHAELARRGFLVSRQAVSDGRFNLVAHDGQPLVTFSTHLDTVPPFIPPREDDRRLWGRGSCDAKGTMAAQIIAASRLRERWGQRVGLLFVVGEERGSDGAAAADTVAPKGNRYLIDGEPTDNRLATATKGILRLKLRASGRAAHSSIPEQGDSAIEKLVDAIVRLRSVPLPGDPVLGPTLYTVGLIEGGRAPNIVPDEAAAEVLYRTIGSADGLQRLAEDAVRPLAEVERVLVVPPVRLETIDGFAQAVMPFTTDIPLLAHWGKPLLLGSGSVTTAHTLEEHVLKSDLEEAVELYERLGETLLARLGSADEERDGPGA